MKVSMFGAGYVGLVTASCFSDSGHEVICVDADKSIVNNLNKGVLHIYEPNLKEIIQRNSELGSLEFTGSAEIAVNHGDIIFIGVDTPPAPDGSSDLKNIEIVANTIGNLMNEEKIIAIKSTVPVGTSERVSEIIKDCLIKRGLQVEFSVCSNPEFLKEGSAVNDFVRPDRIIIGSENENVKTKMTECYAPFNRQNNRLIFMSTRSSELTKYAANAMLATKISFINELSQISEKLNVDIEEVRNGIGSDSRIGTNFLYPGCGYGGSCFPKDIKSLIHVAKKNNSPSDLLNSVLSVNEKQKDVLFNKLNSIFEGDLRGKKIALWGLAFKPETDDMREAPSIKFMESVWEAGGLISAYDPKASKNCQDLYGNKDNLILHSNHLDALDGAHALVICTEWKVFRSINIKLMKTKLLNPIIIDGRNLYDPSIFEGTSFRYYGISRGDSLS